MDIIALLSCLSEAVNKVRDQFEGGNFDLTDFANSLPIKDLQQKIEENKEALKEEFSSIIQEGMNTTTLRSAFDDVEGLKDYLGIKPVRNFDYEEINPINIDDLFTYESRAPEFEENEEYFRGEIDNLLEDSETYRRNEELIKQMKKFRRCYMTIKKHFEYHDLANSFINKFFEEIKDYEIVKGYPEIDIPFLKEDSEDLL